MSDPSIYTVGWICAISVEYVAANLCLDEEHPELRHRPSPHDTNAYILGRIGEHNVVIASLPDGCYGTTSAATVASCMLHTFPNIRIGLMVGIGGGAPRPPKHDIRLGDIVVSSPKDGNGGVLQYDFGKEIQGQGFAETGFLNQPPVALRSGVSKIKLQHRLKPSSLGDAIAEILNGIEDEELQSDLSRPAMDRDRLYKSNVTHNPDNEGGCDLCHNALEALVVREDRNKRPHAPRVHYGLIGSGNSLITDATYRDRMATTRGILCFEMEAAGLMNDFPCIVIRGICDYSDSHKNDKWHSYAALAAAAYAKELLKVMPSHAVEAEQKIVQIEAIMKTLREEVDKLSRGIYSITQRQRGQQESEILNWITPFEYSEQHNLFTRKREEGTGKWLLESPEFIAWLDDDQQTLFCPGIPGAGKTIITSMVISHLQSTFDTDEKTGIAYLYCDYKQPQTEEDLLRIMLKQLAERSSALPCSVVTLYNKHNPRRTTASMHEISEALLTVIASYSKVFLIIDALDECHSSGTRIRLLNKIFSIQGKTKTRLFATSRDILEITELFVDCGRLEIRARDEDIERYLDARLDELPTFVRCQPQLCQKIKTTIITRVDGMFLLAQFHMNSLTEAATSNDVEAQLEGLPFGDQAYDETYDIVIERIQMQGSQRGALAMKVLCWVTCAKRRLRKRELEHALAIVPGQPELDTGNIPQSIVSVCAGLVLIDQESGVVRLAHYTIQEYMKQRQHRLFPKAEEQITKVCVSYLSLREFRSGPCKTSDEVHARLERNPMYDYASKNWGHHARQCPLLCRDIMEFLGTPTLLQASIQGLHWRWPRYSSKSKPHWTFARSCVEQATGLHIAAYFGVSQAVDYLLKGSNVNATDAFQRTPLSYAAEEGHLHTVQVLTKTKRVNISLSNREQMTPLCYASEGGHDAVVTLLLELLDYKPRFQLRHRPNKDMIGKALGRAIQVGHGSIARQLLDKANTKERDQEFATAVTYGPDDLVRLFLEKGADANIKKGDTALMLASSHGQEGVVRLLLDQGIDANIKDVRERTALWLATLRGREGIVRLLVNKGADINIKDDEGRTALWVAALCRKEGIVRLLLDEGADVDTRDKWGKTALFIATVRGQEGIVRLLLNKGADVNIRDDAGRTALWAAASCGQEGVVRLLRDNGANMEAMNALCQTPLSTAAQNGHAEVVDALVTAEGVDVNAEDVEGRTPLWYALAGVLEVCVQMLAEKSGAKLGSKHLESCNPILIQAAKRGYHTIVKVLLAEALNDLKPEYCQMALWWALARDDETMLHLLLPGSEMWTGSEDQYHLSGPRKHEVLMQLSKRIDLNIQGYDDLTPLAWAFVEDKEDLIKLILTNDDVDVNINFKVPRLESIFELTPLEVAVKEKKYDLAKLLLDRKHIDVNQGMPLKEAAGDGDTTLVTMLLAQKGIDVNREAPLVEAIQFGKRAVVKMLLAEEDIDVNAEGLSGTTALMAAAKLGDSEIVSQLLSHKGVTKEVVHGRWGNTPLMTAVELGHEEVVTLLLKEEGIGLNYKNKYGDTALSLAREYHHEKITDLLLANGALEKEALEKEALDKEALEKEALDKDGLGKGVLAGVRRLRHKLRRL